MRSIRFINNTGGINFNSGLVNTFDKVASYYVQKTEGGWTLWITYLHWCWETKVSKQHSHYSPKFTKQEVEQEGVKAIVALMRKNFS